MTKATYEPPTRRRFLTSLTGAGISGRLAGSGANDRIAVGVIGVGGRGRLLIDQLPEQAQVIAVAETSVARVEFLTADAAQARLVRREAKTRTLDVKVVELPA